MRRERIAVGLSGGVDSALAAALLVEAGHEVIGLTMRIWDESLGLRESRGHACLGPDEAHEVADAAAVARQLGIPHHVFDLSEEYGRTVLGYFRSEYLAGRTPNPCVVCNRSLKFGLLLRGARRSGLSFDAFATGHYVRTAERDGRWYLLKGADPGKDQSYFLVGLSRADLPGLRFPLGAFDKTRTRNEARRLGLVVAEREESQDFVAGGDYTPLFTPGEVRPGEIVDAEGRVLGRHEGIVRFTVGQRRGLGVAADRPLYVLRLEAATNRVVVSDRDDLLADGLEGSGLNLLGADTLEPGRAVQARLRQGQREFPARAWQEAGDPTRFRLLFDAPRAAVAPGQFAVLYDGDVVLGGGVIDRPVRRAREEN